MTKKKHDKSKTKSTKEEDKKGSSIEQPQVQLVDELSEAFHNLESRIRQRAYQIFLDRDEESGDPVADWIGAQMEMVTPIDLEVKEQKKNIIVEGKMKGFTPKEIEVEIEDRQLRVFGSHTESKSKAHGATRETSEKSTHFYQSITLPCHVAQEASEAKLLKNGKLKITLPRKDPD